ncbi:MAG: SDR family NAD(P)-dependent oxidoreductase [Betaproteobacteria bacterium]|nr:SDR family NAD(P)-dependent oxidoreductase [Betaproteobacteria bacterium]
MTEGMLKDRVAIVTGAAGGFGRVIVQGLLAQGARVAALDVDDVGLSAMRPAMEGAGDRLLTIHADIADYAQCERAVDTTIRSLGGLHVLVNNAAVGMGVIRKDHMVNPIGIAEISPDTWSRFVAVNFTGAWQLTHAAVPHLLAQRWGRIVNVTTSFFTMLRGSFHPYGPTKAGLEAMSAGHAKEFEGTGITVNVVVPGGPADTPLVPEESGFRREDLIPASVMAPPIVWLCSDEANDVTGNRYVAAQWDVTMPAARAAEACRGPIAWPQLAQSPVWPGGKPDA